MGTSHEERQTLERLLDEPGGLLLLHLPMAIYVADSQGRFAFCNTEARALLRLPADGPAERSIADFFKQPEQYAELVRAAATGDDAAATGEEKWGPGSGAGKARERDSDRPPRSERSR